MDFFGCKYKNETIFNKKNRGLLVVTNFHSIFEKFMLHLSGLVAELCFPDLYTRAMGSQRSAVEKDCLIFVVFDTSFSKHSHS